MSFFLLQTILSKPLSQYFGLTQSQGPRNPNSVLSMLWNGWLVLRLKKEDASFEERGCPRPKEHQLPSSFFQFLSSFFATSHWLLLCLPPSLPLCSVTTGHLLCHTRFLYRAAKKSAATSPALFKPCLFLFQKSQLLGLSVTVMFVRFFERFFFSLIFAILFVHYHHHPPYPPLIPKPQSTSSSSRWTPSSWHGRAWGVSRRRLVMGAD